MRLFSRFQFRFRLVPFFATLIVLAIGIALAQWQLGRAHQKQTIEANLIGRSNAPPYTTVSSIEAAAGDATSPADRYASVEFRRLKLKGEFIVSWPLYLDNRPYQGRAGLYVLMPFRLAGSEKVILVARGWIARNVLDRKALPPLYTPSGGLDLTGQLRRGPGHVLQLGQPSELRPGAIVQNLDLRQLAQVSGLPLQSYLVEQTSELSDHLIRDWPRPSSGIDRHLGYAFQWYALSAMACIFFVVTGFKRL
jgi:surfeit locus 1 family protein